MIKKLFYLIIIVLLVTLLGDYFLTMSLDRQPWFIIKTEDNIKYGLIYKIDYNETTKFYIFNFKVDELKNTNRYIEIIDKTKDGCDQVITYFYEDDSNKYYLGCAKDIYIKVDNIEYTLKNALANDLVTLDELKEQGLEYEIEKKTD